MQTIRRILVGIALLVWLAIPAVGNGGGGGGGSGDNAGGTGVWILPAAMPLVASPGTLVRDTKLVNNLNQDLWMTVSAGCGSVVATFVDEVSGVTSALPVSGSQVCVPRAVLQAVAAGGAKSSIVIANANQVGYQIEIVVGSSSSSTSLSLIVH